MVLSMKATPAIPLEDLFYDILGKAMRGLGMSVADVAAKAGLSESAAERVLEGKLDAHSVSAMAKTLGLHDASLLALGKNQWQPRAHALNGLELFNTPYPGMTVNAYLVWDPVSPDALIFDTGTDASAIVESVNRRDLSVRTIFLTHTHKDHIMDLDRLRRALPGVPVLVGRKEPVAGADCVDEGDRFSFGGLSVEARLTAGHSVGGITYVVNGLGVPLAIVGDALFAGSMGGGMISWSEALENNRTKLFTLPDETIVCPGHGPMTTIGEEKAHNPCYPEFKKS